jgi:aminocarboxymuconate-semialdehyde decarboxylase
VRIDVHAHWLPEDRPEWRARLGDGRVVDDSYWSLERRTALLDELGIDVQVLSPFPALLPWWAPADEALDWCRAMNEALASAVGVRFRALGIVPLQDCSLAVAELERIRDLGLAGVEVGTAVDERRTFADPAVDDFLAACVELELPVLLHPNRPNPFGATRAALDAGLWRPSDTALVVGERLLRGWEAPAGLRVCIAHGGGSLPWLWSRVAIIAGAGDGLPEWISLDTAGCTPRQVDHLIDVLGPDRVFLGTDLPAGRRPAIEALLAGMAVR